jgi:hypothetical protein
MLLSMWAAPPEQAAPEWEVALSPWSSRGALALAGPEVTLGGTLVAAVGILLGCGG